MHYISVIMVVCMMNIMDVDSGTKPFQLKNGDLLFQDLDCGELCEAIEKVTYGYKNANLSHVGIVYIDESNNEWVIEAISESVSKTPIDTFLNRSLDEHGHPKVIAGRVRKAFEPIVDSAVAEAMEYIGKPYDHQYGIMNQAVYCSELIYKSFFVAYNYHPFFELKPMTFIDPETEKIFPAWKNYFSELNIPVPEGKPGINPGAISRSNNIKIVHAYGIPSGWRSNVLEKQ